MKNFDQIISEFEVWATDTIPPLTNPQGNMNVSAIRSRKPKSMTNLDADINKARTLRLRTERKRKYSINEEIK